MHIVNPRFLSLKVLVVAKAMGFSSCFPCLPSDGELREIQVIPMNAVDSGRQVCKRSYLLGQCRRMKMAGCEKNGELWGVLENSGPV